MIITDHYFSASDELSFVSCLCNIKIVWLQNCKVTHVDLYISLTTVLCESKDEKLHKRQQRSACWNVHVVSI